MSSKMEERDVKTGFRSAPHATVNSDKVDLKLKKKTLRKFQ